MLKLDSQPAASTQARRALCALEGRISERIYSDLRFVVTELVTNSVKHGPGEPIAVRLTSDEPARVRGEVADGGRLGDRAPVPSELAERGAGGLGLRIVDALTSRWGVDEDGARVWFEVVDTGAEG